MTNEDYKDAFLHSQPDGQDAMVRYVRNPEEMLTIRISDLPEGGYHFYIEKVSGHGILACEGALEIILDKYLKESPKFKPHPESVGLIRTHRAYETMGHPLRENIPRRLEVIDCSKSPSK